MSVWDPAILSAGPAAGGRRLAVLIGIDRYARGIPPLRNAVRDVEAVAQVLKELHNYHVRCVVDEQASLSGLRRLLGDLRAEAGPDDRLILYFAGHGIAEELDPRQGQGQTQQGDGPRGYLMPQDADRDDPATFWPMSEVQEQIAGLSCRHLLLVLDCCFAGAFRWSSTREVLVRRRTLYRERYERYERDPAWQVLTSTAHDEKALDVISGQVLGCRGEAGAHSPFASALCEGLRGVADLRIGGEPGDGVILASELQLYLETAMERLEQQLGRSQQKPMLWSLGGKDKGQFFFLVPGQQPELPSALELTEHNNPYRGLAAYEEDHQALFFGRAQIAATLCTQVQGQPLTVVVGASGTGKSSLVQAGLLPRLRPLRAPPWRLLPPLRPGARPLLALAEAAAQLGGAATGLLEEAVAAFCHKDSQTQILLVIDQAEELITLGGAEQQEFLRRLAEAGRSGAGRLHLVLTLRSDFEPHFRDLLSAREGQARRFLIPHMSRAELREAIEGPATERVLYFDPPALVERLIDEVIDMPGALPLLSFTLSEMYRAYVQKDREDRTLSEADYQALGEVSGALSQRADEIYAGLDAAHQATLRRLMLRMVVPGELARRRVLLAELSFASRDEQARVEQVLRRLSEARLLVSGQDAQGQSYIEPAHDKLVMGWQRLRAFIDEEKAQLPLQRSLTLEAQEWQLTGRPGARLWAGDPRLPQLLALRRQTPARFNALESEFITLSRRRRLLGRAGVAAALVLIVAGLGLGLYGARRDAHRIRGQLLATYVEQGRQHLLGGDPMHALLWLNRAYQEQQEGAADPALRYLLARAAGQAAAVRITLAGHEGGVRDAAFSPDGARVLTASVDGTARVWDARTGDLLATLQGHDKGVVAAAFSPDGTRVVSASYDHTARVWEAGTGRLLATLTGHADQVVAAAFSPDGERVVTASHDGTARLWEAGTGRLLATLTGHADQVVAATFSPDGERVVTASHDGTARLWEGHTGRLLLNLTGHRDRVVAAVFSPDGQEVMTAGYDRTARLWEARTGRLLASLQGHEKAVVAVAMSPDGRSIVTASHDKTAKLWEARTGRLLASLQGHGDRVVAAAFSPDGARVITAGYDRTARLWEARTGSLLGTLAGHTDIVWAAAMSPDGTSVVTASNDRTAKLWNAGAGHLPETLAGHQAGVLNAAFSPDGTSVVTTSGDRTARLWDVRTGRPLVSLSGHGDTVWAAALSLDGARVVTASGDGTAGLWDARTGRLLYSLRGHRDEVVAAAFSPDEGRVVTASYDGTAKLWDARGGGLLGTLAGHAGPVLSAALSPDGGRVVTASGDGTARLWDARTGRLLATLKGHDKEEVVAAFSPDGARVVTAGADGTARLWDARSGAFQAALIGHGGAVRAASFSPDGALVVTASADGTAKLWDARLGQPLLSLDGHDDQVVAASFSPDGALVVTASHDRTARLWDARTGHLLAVLAGHTESVLAASFSPNGALVVTASGDRTAKLWDVRLETRKRGEIAVLVRCRVPFRFAGDAILPATPDRQSCPGGTGPDAPLHAGTGEDL